MPILDRIEKAAGSLPFAVDQINEADMVTEVGTSRCVVLYIPTAYKSGRDTNIIRFAVSEPKPNHLLLCWTPITVEHWHFSEKALPVVQKYLAETAEKLPGSYCALHDDNTLHIELNVSSKDISDEHLRDILFTFHIMIVQIEGLLKRAVRGDLGPVKNAWKEVGSRGSE
jgi:hypothetical protein